MCVLISLQDYEVKMVEVNEKERMNMKEWW